jgi:hypothetical protein
VTDDESITAERYRRELDEIVNLLLKGAASLFSGPVTDGERRRSLNTDERYQRELDEVVVLSLILANVAHSPALNAESGLLQHPDVGVGRLQAVSLVHVLLIVLDGSKAPVRRWKIGIRRECRELGACGLRRLAIAATCCPCRREAHAAGLRLLLIVVGLGRLDEVLNGHDHALIKRVKSVPRLCGLAAMLTWAQRWWLWH